MADLKEKLGHFTLLSCRVRQRNVPKSITQVYSHQYCSLKAHCHDIQYLLRTVINSQNGP